MRHQYLAETRDAARHLLGTLQKEPEDWTVEEVARNVMRTDTGQDIFCITKNTYP